MSHFPVGSYISKFLSSLNQPRIPWLLSYEPKIYYALVALASYLLFVRSLRFRRVSALKKKYGVYPTGISQHQTSPDASYQGLGGRPDLKLTPEEAQKIVQDLSQLEMPGLTRIATTLALFKTYAISSISEILLKTGQLSSSKYVGRRVADTTILLSVPVTCPWVDCAWMNLSDKDVDSRGALAIARINWLHKRWPQIKNDDFIYTLSLFILEPIRWANKYGWRDMLPVEREAYFVLWKEIGLRLNVKDIPKTLEELSEWSKNYEETNMFPWDSNFEVGMHTLNLLQDVFPKALGISYLVQQMIIGLLEDRVREAFKLPPPPRYIRYFTGSLMTLIAFRDRYLSFPRFKRVLFFTTELTEKELKNPLPRMHLIPITPQKEPWYEFARTGFFSLVGQSIKIKLGLLDETRVPGPKYKSEGFRLEECGPVSLEKYGHDDVMKMAAAIQGCPVSGAWARQT